jgi:hypothetical protein
MQRAKPSDIKKKWRKIKLLSRKTEMKEIAKFMAEI